MLNRRPRREPIEGRDDDVIVAAYPFLRRWKAFSRRDGSPFEIEELRREALYYDDPGLYDAIETFYSPTGDETRTMLESYILARMNDREISQRITLDPRHVDWYEKLFFNVRDRIDSYRYVMDIVVGSPMNQGIEQFSLDQTTKWFAYWAGPEIAELIYDGYDKMTPVPGPEQDKMQFFYDHFARQCIARGASGVNSIGLDKWSFKDYSEYSFRVMELVRAKDNEQGGLRSPLEDIASVMMNVVPWSVGSSRDKIYAGTPAAPYIGHAAEPRVSEVLAISNDDPPFDPSYLEDQTLPPPRERDSDDK